jgi:hypothetical protein
MTSYDPGSEDYEFDSYRIERDERGIIDRLVYINYAHNRDNAPNISMESWKRVYGKQTEQLEAMYQKEKADEQTARRRKAGAA